ncbi:MAG: RNA pseudouridine synthase [Candidatus Omnitrophica bacterium]|nr:RNA pseudouridine synthase [Candidatus Omnitrophota bacterium]
MNIPVVYQDKWLMVVDKPSGLLVIPTPRNEARTLTSILNSDAKAKGLAYRLHPCHRLDRDTSGLVIYAKGKSFQQAMMRMFKEKKIKKTYLGFVQGALAKAHGRISYPIDSQPSSTEYRTIKACKDFTVVAIMPETGRKNQIRIHFKRIGHPLVGERRFAFRKDFAIKAKRLCLHAQQLVFRHPVTGQEVRVKSALPEYFKLFLQQHRVSYEAKN